MPRQSGVPKYGLHRPTGQARVVVGGGHIYLGNYDSPESKERYARLVAELTAVPDGVATTPASAPALTIVELVAAFWDFAETHYRRGGEPTGELSNLRYAIRPLKSLYGSTPAAEFEPRKLKAVRQSMIESGLCRNQVNSRVAKLKRVFRWGVSEGLLRPTVYHGLQAVMGLQRGRTEARETEPVGPV